MRRPGGGPAVRALLTAGPVGTMSVTLVKRSPPSVDSPTNTSHLAVICDIHRFPYRSHASPSSQVCPTWAAVANRRRFQVRPPSNDTPMNSPWPFGQVMAATFRGLVGLMAMVFSASLPGRWLTSKFGGTGGKKPRAGAAAGFAAAPSTAATRPSTPSGTAASRPPWPRADSIG